MPELPEVETTRRGLEPLITDRRIVSVHIYKPRLRWEIPTHLTKTLNNQTIRKITRRAKYLLLHFDIGQLVMHLGMSGSISVVNPIEPLKKHEHFELKLDNSSSLRFNDPRRFGSVLWQKPNETLTLLKNLGPEPLSYEFDNDSLFKSSNGKSRNIKSFIMDSNVVVGVGNIYASESLFLSSISPLRDAKDLDLNECKKLVASGKKILKKAINVGGTTLKDFYSADGSPGYFKFELNVYGRENESCNNCCENISKIVINQRATFFCKSCQN